VASNLVAEMMLPRGEMGDSSQGEEVKETTVEGVVEGMIDGAVKEEEELHQCYAHLNQ
jgi:hypothetical protein